MSYLFQILFDNFSWNLQQKDRNDGSDWEHGEGLWGFSKFHS